MVFSSMIFLWKFLPITLIIYYIFPAKMKNLMLLIASLLFYAWGEPVYILLMLLSITANYALGILISRFNSHKNLFLVICLIMNLSILGYYKYCNFLLSILNSIFHTRLPYHELALPIGISFYTFQAISYIIDLYRNEYPVQKNILDLALYIAFFPQLIAGPIVKYKEINSQLNTRNMSSDLFLQGIRRFCYGLGKKVLIANVLASVVDNIYAMDKSDLSSFLVWTASLFYTFQIYYDFSGYSDMAIGLGKMFGFNFQENFNYPYLSHSIQNFWQRWHISLGSWFKEYVYIPLGGNRRSCLRTYINLMIVFFLTGMWHGAGFSFILWGLYHVFFSVIERLGLGKKLSSIKPLGFIYSFFIVNFGWVMFRSENVHQAFSFFRRMLYPLKYINSTLPWQTIVDYKSIVIFIIAILGCGILQYLFNNCKISKKWSGSNLEMFYCTLILLLSIASLASNTYNPFIYFRF